MTGKYESPSSGTSTEGHREPGCVLKQAVGWRRGSYSCRGMGEIAKPDPQSLCFEYEETEGPSGPQLSEINWWLPGAAGKHGGIRTWFWPREEQFHLVQFFL